MKGFRILCLFSVLLLGNSVVGCGPPEHLLRIVITGQGSVSVTPGPRVCTGNCVFYFAPATQVTLTAQPASGWQFAVWGSNCSGATPTQNLTMNEGKTCTASFIQP